MMADCRAPAADVTDEEQVAGLVAAVTPARPVDVLVLNATGPQPEWAAGRRGVAGPPRPA
jgi:NADP-dependent 3-hydroxy acid dehydrogenase YdfG